MKRTPLIPLLVAAALFLTGTSSAATLYHYNFDNGTSGSWTPDDASWTICKTVATGTPEYCQTDATAQLATKAFDGDVTWSDYSIQADVKLDNYLSGEIGIIGRAQDATHYYQLSLKSEPTTGARMWWISRNDGGVVTVIASGSQYFQSGYYYPIKLTFYKQFIQASFSNDGGLTFDSLGFAEDTRYPAGKIGLMTTNTKGVFDNVIVNALGAPNTRRFGHIVIMTLENQNYTSIIGNPNMPYLNSLLGRGALLTNFYANFHPSEPNYFALTTGQSFYTKEGPIPTGTNEIVRALATKSKTWKLYFTDVTTHEAVFRYFPEIWQNSTELAKIVPIFPDFMNDVRAGTLPSYSIIHDVPEINGHDCTVAGICMGPVDDQLQATIDPYLSHPSFVANNDLLIVLFDEANLTDTTCSGPTTIAMTEAVRIRGGWTCGGRTVALFLGAGVKRGYQSTALYHLEAFLRLSLEGLGVTDSLPGASAFAPNMDELFESADTTPPTAAAAPSGGSFAAPQSITLTAVDNNPGSSIYFTTNGSTPTSASTRYTAPIGIATTTTLKYVAIDAAGNVSAVRSETYAIASAPPGALPAGWQTQDIGAVAVGGNASFASGTYNVTGAGADIWGTADALRYAYTTLNGDGQITARVATEENVNVWTKAGVMMRESLAPGSRQALMLISPGKGSAFQRRVAASGVSTHTAGAFVTAPYWVRLSRVGSTITASESVNGTTWTVVGSDTIAFGQTVLVGVAVSSHSTTAAATGTFDNVAIETLWSNQDIGAVGLSGSTSLDAGVFTLTGAGADIWGAADAFHFTYQQLTGDGEIVAHVDTVSATNAWHKVAVMIRNDLTPGSEHGMMLVSSAKGLAFQRRVSTGGVSTSTAGPLLAAPQWVRVARAGNLITASYSADGTAWTTLGSDTIVMGPTVYIGLATSSHSNTALGTATVDSVRR
ncbi:MAG TPA: chitobiase/beta-hexosaminidase C-terminal domain-containing protein [Gemmatimonadaceae bacterium]